MTVSFPQLPDDIWLEIIYYSGFDDVWTMVSHDNVDYIFGRNVQEDEDEYDDGDPWFFITPDDVFELIFGRPPNRIKLFEKYEI